jgi:hypothetical protein
MSHKTKLFCISLALLSLSSANALVYSVAQGDVSALKAAIDEANASPEADVIELETGLYALDASGTNVALPVIRSPIVIRGRAELRAYSKNTMHLLEVAKSGDLLLQDVTLAEGNDGALVNMGHARLHNVTITDQSTRKAPAIISNFGELSLVDCDISYNTMANAVRDSGTILNYGTAGIERSRIHANRLSRKYHSLALASALLNFGKARLSYVEISDNAANDANAFTVTGRISALVNRGNGEIVAHAVSDTGNIE